MMIAYVLALIIGSAAIAEGQPAAPTARAVLSPDGKIADLVLVRVSGRHAVVRFGSGPLLLVETGDRLGASKAEVVAIETGRLVLDERYESARGPQAARLIFKPGERGGTRYLARPDQDEPASSRPVILPRKPGDR
jgi:hypothetical protein